MVQDIPDDILKFNFHHRFQHITLDEATLTVLGRLLIDKTLQDVKIKVQIAEEDKIQQASISCSYPKKANDASISVDINRTNNVRSKIAPGNESDLFVNAS